MPINVSQAVRTGHMAPDIADAIESIKKPEVQRIIRELSQYNLAVCVPHMHSTEQPFSVLPQGIMQIENDRQVSWVEKNAVDDPDVVPVAWRWDADETGEGGEVVECSQCLGPPCNPIKPDSNVFTPMDCYDKSDTQN